MKMDGYINAHCGLGVKFLFIFGDIKAKALEFIMYTVQLHTQLNLTVM